MERILTLSPSTVGFFLQDLLAKHGELVNFPILLTFQGKMLTELYSLHSNWIVCVDKGQNSMNTKNQCDARISVLCVDASSLIFFVTLASMAGSINDQCCLLYCFRWVSKLIRKKHNSSVTSVAWHPNNVRHFGQVSLCFMYMLVTFIVTLIARAEILLWKLRGLQRYPVVLDS